MASSRATSGLALLLLVLSLSHLGYHKRASTLSSSRGSQSDRLNRKSLTRVQESHKGPRRKIGLGGILGKRRPQTAVRSEEFRTPHSGYHWNGIPSGRFFEGWYFRVTIPEIHQSFAFIYSVEDPGTSLPTAGVGVQVMGPSDGYAVQYSKKTHAFWGNRMDLALGATFQTLPLARNKEIPSDMLSSEEFSERVHYGFQTNSTWNQGHIRAVGVTPPGSIDESVSECRWEIETRPSKGWGENFEKQKSTAGWLSALPIFEPHWQVLMADGRSDGWVEWGGKRYEFRDAPTYAEKNWGAGFPSKWWWIQCNAFTKYGDTTKDLLDISLTSVGALRKLPGVSNEEAVGMVAIHYNGRFFPLTPGNSKVSWSVTPWGTWNATAVVMNEESSENLPKLRAEVTSISKSPGTPLRAPTDGQGLAVVCRDTFEGEVRLKVWEDDELLVDAISKDGGLEIGGGPWEDVWSAEGTYSPAVKALLELDLDWEDVFKGPLEQLRPPGL
ncbi:hypothetical protein AAMO2058_000503800 [Amorphochlora amoebiformis]